jgi:hypothetical protein
MAGTLRCMSSLREAAFTFFQTLDRLGIIYAEGSSLASSLHGIARATQDIDLVIDLHAGQIKDFCRALAPSSILTRVPCSELLGKDIRLTRSTSNRASRSTYSWLCDTRWAPISTSDSILRPPRSRDSSTLPPPFVLRSFSAPADTRSYGTTYRLAVHYGTSFRFFARPGPTLELSTIFSDIGSTTCRSEAEPR